MDKSVKDIRSFVIKQMLSSEWTSSGRSDFYSSDFLTIKKDFDKSIWVFSIQDGTYHEFKDLGINKLFLYILIFFVKRSDKKRVESRRYDKLKNEWTKFLSKNKDIDRDNKLNKIIND